uniref:Prepilin-type N-terminal cleavage/methylation domain-containing protein n=1 Tax=mine drainage metagenome TaxID=410659 RepID=E6PI55_9ZZZZ
MESQRGFTLLETVAALGIVSLLLLAGLRLATLARAPGATANAAAQLDAAIALARSLARASGNGATLLALPRFDARGHAVLGFRIVLYRGRPTAAGAATISRELPLVTDASLREASLGAPPFALFFRRDGSAVGSAHPTLTGAALHPQLATIAAEPPCPSASGMQLSLTRNGATVTREMLCPAQSSAVAGPQPSMTPNPPVLAPRALLFRWPTAPTQWFSIAEFGYRRWFAATGGAMAGFTCRGSGAAVVAFPTAPPYSGPQSLADAQSTPAPPSAPYAYAVAASNAPGAMDDAPAHFPVQPVAAGLCGVPLVDAFAQSHDPWGNPLVVAMQVMGWLTLSNPLTNATTRNGQAPLPVGPLAQGQSFTVNASKTFDNDPAGITLTGLSWNPASCGSALTFTASGNNTAGSSSSGTATHSFVITDSSAPASALTCTGTLTDQYGEPAVSFTTNVAAGASAMLTWPAGGVVEATSGSTLGMLPMHEPLIATFFGAKMADALTTGCKAVAIQSGTYPTSYTPATILGAQGNGLPLPAAVQTLLSGQGYTVDGSGCVWQHGALATQAPIVAYEPGGTSAQYSPSIPCPNIASLGSPNPISQYGAQVEWGVIPGSTAGSCTVTIAASPAPSGTPGPGSGLVPVQVAQYPCQFIGGSCTLPAGGLGQNTTACDPTTHSGSGSITSYRYYWYGTPPQSPSAPGPVPATVGTVSGLNPSTFTRTGPGTVYGIMVIMTRNMAGWPCRFTNGGNTWSLFVTVP